MSGRDLVTRLDQAFRSLEAEDAAIEARVARGLCDHGPWPVRPRPGDLCEHCDRYIVGPPKAHRRQSRTLTQTLQTSRGRRALSGIAGSR